jgi:hypothetical protein
MVDFSKIQEGDEVTVKVRVLGVALEGDKAAVQVGFSGMITWVGDSQIASHTPKPREPKVGDWVKHDTLGWTVEVIAIGPEQFVGRDRYGHLSMHTGSEPFMHCTIVSEPEC